MELKVLEGIKIFSLAKFGETLQEIYAPPFRSKQPEIAVDVLLTMSGLLRGRRQTSERILPNCILRQNFQRQKKRQCRTGCRFQRTDCL